jgi:7-cyano-7-deazaguanine synthase
MAELPQGPGRGARAVVMLSGGLDSTVALFWARDQGLEALPVSIEFAGRPKRELAAVHRVVEAARAGPLTRMPLPFVQLAGELPAYKGAERPVPYGYIPMRNLLFYTLAAYHADGHGARYIVGGQLREDAVDFPDASAAYFAQVNELLKRSTNGWSRAGPPEVLLPLAGLNKEDVIRLGARLGVPFDLTWSCWLDGERPCGLCLSCKDRAEAFEKAGVRDAALP